LQSIRRSKSNRSVTDTKKRRKHGVKNMKNRTKIESLKHGYNRKLVMARKKNSGGGFGFVDRFRNWRANNQGSHGALKPLSAPPPPPEQPETQKTWKSLFTFGKSKIHNTPDTVMPLNSMISTTPVLPAPSPPPLSHPPHHLTPSPTHPPPPSPRSHSHFKRTANVGLPPPPQPPTPTPTVSSSSPAERWEKPDEQNSNYNYDYSMIRKDTENKNVFFIGGDGPPFSVRHVETELNQLIDKAKANDLDDHGNIIFLGNQDYTGSAGRKAFGGNADIWLQKITDPDDVNYIVRINRTSGRGYYGDEPAFWPIWHVPTALNHINKLSLIRAFHRMGIQGISENDNGLIEDAAKIVETTQQMLQGAKNANVEANTKLGVLLSEKLKGITPEKLKGITWIKTRIRPWIEEEEETNS
jgi:hypothetical protein